MGGHVATTTRMITIPYLTNSEEVKEGEELLLEVDVKVQKQTLKPTSLTWKDVAKKEAARPNNAPKFVIAAAVKPAATAPAATAPAAAAPSGP